jgi:GNAT superfamily N-acetyltransferase
MLSHEDVVTSTFRSPDEFRDFQCEKKEYCDFVQKPEEALEYYKENLGVTYVFWSKSDQRPIGFVTLAMGSLKREELPAKREGKKPFRHVPGLLLGHMARDKRYKGKGAGQIMVDWVLSKASSLGDEVGCRFVILDSERDMVERYKGYAFELIPREPNDRTCVMFFDLGIRTS